MIYKGDKRINLHKIDLDIVYLPVKNCEFLTALYSKLMGLKLEKNSYIPYP